MQQKFFVENLVQGSLKSASSTDIPLSPVNAQFPLSNLDDDRRTKVFRSTTNNVSIVFDLGIARDINSILIVDSGIGSFGFVTADIQFNAVDSWGSIPSQSISIDPIFGFANLLLTSVEHVRFVRLTLNNTAGYCELSKIFIGEDVSVGELSFSYPITFRQNNNATMQKNRLGQKFFDEINSQKELEGSFNTINKEELESLFEVFDYASFTRPVWIFFPEGQITTNNHRLCGYYYLKDDPSMQLLPANYWNVTLKFEEGT